MTTGSRKCKKSLLILVLVLTILADLTFLRATESKTTAEQNKKNVFTLEDAITHALTHSPLVEKTRLERKKVRLLLDEVKQKNLIPEFSLSGETGVVPEARGDIFSSPDKQTDLDGFGPFIKLNIKIIQPLLTFGRKSAAQKAAHCGIDLQNIQSRSEIEKLTLKVIEAYWALNAARKAVSISKEVTENYNKLVTEVKKRLDTEDSEVDDTDLLEVQSNRYQIEEIHIKSQSEQKIAQRLFNLALGRDQTAPADVSGSTIPTLTETETQLLQKIRQVLSRHGDLKGLQAAVKALQAQSKLAVTKKRPVIFLAGGFGYGYAPGREDQTNPFAVDGFNYTNLGAYVGFQWDLNSFRKNVEAERHRLEKKAMEQNLKLLRSKIEMEILKAYTEVKQNTQLLEQAEKSLKSAKNWLRLSMDNWEMGIGEVERLIKAYNAYYQLKGVEIKRTLELNISLANFAYRLGNTKLYLEWVKNGNVKIY